MTETFGVIIPAAGSGSRFGGDKLMAKLRGKPVLWHTLSAFQQAKTVSSIVISARPDNIPAIKEISSSFSKVIAVIPGGLTRQESVSCGLGVIPKDTNYVSIHDGARPLILPEEIDRIHFEAVRHGAVCAAMPVYDTVQQVDADGYITQTPDRAFLMAAATPQVFERALYERACALASGRSYTDDAGMVRAAGGRVKMILCRDENFKITTVQDLLRAEQVFLERRKGMV